VRLAAGALAGAGCGVVVPDMRWHGELLAPEWLPTLGREEARDLLAWARWAAARHPGHPVGLLGFSLGALAAIHAAGAAEAAAALPAGGIAVSPPVALDRTARVLDTDPRLADLGLNAFIFELFQRFLRLRMAALGIRDGLERPFARFLDWLAERLPGLPLGAGGQRLVDLADPGPALAACRVPLLLLAARNDPIFTELTAAELARRAQANPCVHLLETPGGGHIGQLGTYPAWTAEVLHRFFATTARPAAGG
jgi:predicted alpha/beta-fold hydrolase